MTSETILKAIGEVEDRAVLDAKRKPRRGRTWVAIAACVCVMLAALPMFLRQAPPDTTEAADGAPYVTIDGRGYVISPHLACSETLPSGYTRAGETDVVGGYENCLYYVNENQPEWVYVYHEVQTDGTVDETGTLTATEPHFAYVRYVDARVRGMDLISVNGDLYVSMWSAYSVIDEADYDAVQARYGIRIEGDAPRGFCCAGTAVFSGNDTIPRGALESNREGTEIYNNPDDPAVILAKTRWYTAASTGETVHDGFDVFVAWEDFDAVMG